MDIATLIGVIAAFVLILGSIALSGSLAAFIDPASMVIVLGGTVAATLIAENLNRVMSAFKVASHAFKFNPPDALKSLKQILEMSNIARREGVIALENQKPTDDFMAKGLRMVVDGLPPEEISQTLQSEIFNMKLRHTRGQKLFKFMAATAPSMGMIGTLIGLVQMLRTLDDPSSIGPAMAVALLTTFYGAILAFVLFGPIAEKLEKRTAEETANMRVIHDGLLSIVRGEGTQMIQEKLETHLPPTSRHKEAA